MSKFFLFLRLKRGVIYILTLCESTDTFKHFKCFLGSLFCSYLFFKRLQYQTLKNEKYALNQLK
jgi:hypothetical protein